MSFFKCFFTLGLTQYNIASYNYYVGIIKNLQFVVSNAFSIVLSPQYNLQWSHLRVDFCLFHVIYYRWLLNYHFTKTHALCDACSSSYKTTLHLQQVVCWCLNLNARLYWEVSKREFLLITMPELIAQKSLSCGYLLKYKRIKFYISDRANFSGFATWEFTTK